MSGAPASPLAEQRARTMVTPEGIALPIALASRGSRAGALILDVMILFFGLLAFYLTLAWIAGGLLDGTGLDPEAAPRGAQEFMQIMLVLIGFFTCRNWAPAGQRWASASPASGSRRGAAGG